MITRSIDTQTLDQAMRLFWRKGYFNTSLGDIIKYTDFNRATLYKYFHNKEGLFCACLDHYLATITPQVTQSLVSKPHSVDHLISFYQQFLCDDHPFIEQGCLMMATAADSPLHSEKVLSRIERFSTQLKTLIHDQLSPYCKPKKCQQMTAMLVGHTFGLMTLLRMPHTQNIIQDQIHGIVRVLTNPTTKEKTS